MSTTTADTVTSYTHQTAPTQHTKQQGSAADAIQAEIDKHRLRIANAQQLMLDGELSAADLPRNLPNYYKSASLPIKQKLIGSICSGKLIYEKNDYRTIEFNDLIQGICRLGERFDGLEKGQASDFGSLSQEVTRIGFKPGINGKKEVTNGKFKIGMTCWKWQGREYAPYSIQKEAS